jgi:hypothetical protein
MLETAESKRQSLVERATTDEEEDLESWGDSDSETDEPETQELPTVEDANKKELKVESKEEPKSKIEEKVQEEKTPEKSQEEKVEKVEEPVKVDEKKTVTEELKDAAKDEVPVAPEARPETQTPLSNPDSKESWTAVDKSESDDWEQEFELEMTEEEIEKALKNEVYSKIDFFRIKSHKLTKYC